jgi:NADPH:quinone reductase-like Zn-dependent oxidoreductase
MPHNKAAYLTQSAAHTLAVREAPYTKPSRSEILIKNAALAINPIDYLLQQHGTAVMYKWLKYPAVLGHDLAGVVVDIGPEVTRFKVGDRVLASAVGPDESRNRAEEGAFQLYTIVSENAVSAIPDALSFTDAAVLPLGLSTAATALFAKSMLNLSRPSLQPTSTNKTLLIWGGSTSVGLNAIQLAVAAGYQVFTTCSPRNFSLVKSLGALEAWDYNDPASVASIITALKRRGEGCAGALAIGAGSTEVCLSILSALPAASTNRFVAAATFPVQPPARYLATLKFIYDFVAWNAVTTFKGWRAGVKWKLFIGTALVTDEKDLGVEIYNEFLPRALEEKRFVAKPEPEVAGTGLEALQGAMDKARAGVSAKKVVVTL